MAWKPLLVGVYSVSTVHIGILLKVILICAAPVVLGLQTCVAMPFFFFGGTGV
jgi:hypothetical protein